MSSAAVRYPYIGGSLDGLSVAFENMTPSPALKLNGEVYRYGLWARPAPRFAYVYAGRYDEEPSPYKDSYGEESE